MAGRSPSRCATASDGKGPAASARGRAVIPIRQTETAAAMMSCSGKDLPSILAPLSENSRALFLARAELFGSDAKDALAALYGERDDFDSIRARAFAIAAEAYAARPAALHALDLSRVHRPDWFQQPAMLGYSCYVDRFAGTLRGMIARLDYLRDLGVTYLHLMPVTRPREGESDGGYAVADYEAVDPSIGTVADLVALADACRARGISLVSDLALNHTADSHRWAEAAKAGDPHYGAYYHFFPDRSLPDRHEETLEEVFPVGAPGNFSFVPELGQWVWTTFYPYQWDLNYSNPEVFLEMLRLMLLFANRGIEVLRLDSVAFLWKRMGTDCRNLPEVHHLLRAFRALTRIAAPALALKAEAIVTPEHLAAYLGEGAHAGKECHLGYHNTLMVLLWSALAEGRTDRLTRMLRRMPAAPSNTAWITYLRCHDDIGWPVLDVESPDEAPSPHVRFLSEFYAGNVAGSFAEGMPFQTGESRTVHGTCGMLSGLVGLERAEREGRDPTLALMRIRLLHAVIFCFGGIPLLYMGDEIGLHGDHDWQTDPAKAHDSRWLHRPAMDWTRAERAARDGETIPGRVRTILHDLIAARAGFPALHGDTPSRPLAGDNPHVFLMRRSGARGRMLLVANFSDQSQTVTTDEISRARFAHPLRDRLTGRELMVGEDCHLAPYEALWLEDMRP